jgi:hypothetical protein
MRDILAVIWLLIKLLSWVICRLRYFKTIRQPMNRLFFPSVAMLDIITK